MWIRSVVAVLSLATVLASCGDNADCTKAVSQQLIDNVNAAQLAIDNAIITDYITANNITGVQEVNGIRYVIKKQGSGVSPCLENDVQVIYKGTFLSNGETFDSTLSPVQFPLNQLILGWQMTFPAFSKDTQVTIFIPSGYAYGPNGFPPRIPANAILIFDIELVNVR